ncbi:ribosomal protein L7/L12 [Bradyrhizobium sp. JYMT SZCCT0428]|uniref:ribosomal protein L7/L12 n=1 Tax=Bradyrhizobium sp. JYMT SZCCT0428 TaxID=2807673 RepID=UPI001BA6685F|nr:ribosomal protein L7/L12 [Bradyrhizobium sp. JYMT SZCCT0428]MBR1149220.1 ribosomal protein L7/L12 [Bradyrhizobium sp. JYMT SZCCT0428]
MSVTVTSAEGISKTRYCFVVGPIGKDGSPERKHADLLLNAVIRHVLENEEFGYKVKRADEDADPGMIGDRVITDVINSSLVVADLTDLNPNAFYELGIRHSTELPTIHIAKAGTSLPFDNVAHRTIFVDLGDWHSIEQARERLASSVRATCMPGYKVSNPITQANASFKMRQSDDPRDRIIAEMQERMFTLENAIANATNRPEPEPERIEHSPVHAGVFNILVALHRGEKIEAIKAYRAATGAGLKEAKDFIEAVQDDRKIDAIKIHRMVTKAGLAEAKEIVEVLQQACGART